MTKNKPRQRRIEKRPEHCIHNIEVDGATLATCVERKTKNDRQGKRCAYRMARSYVHAIKLDAPGFQKLLKDMGHKSPQAFIERWLAPVCGLEGITVAYTIIQAVEEGMTESAFMASTASACLAVKRQERKVKEILANAPSPQANVHRMTVRQRAEHYKAAFEAERVRRIEIESQLRDTKAALAVMEQRVKMLTQGVERLHKKIA